MMEDKTRDKGTELGTKKGIHVHIDEVHEAHTEIRFETKTMNKCMEGMTAKCTPADNSVNMSSTILGHNLVGEFMLTLKSKQAQYLSQHDDKLHLKESQYQQMQQNCKKLSLDEIETVTTHLKVLHDEITEIQRQRNEFVSCCNEIEQKLSSIMTTSSYSSRNQVELLKKKFLRECIRIFKALPIYARRCDILDAIHKHQVVVLIGETGSGKSTQIVQYLYEDGYCENNDLIACTQPRKIAAITLANHVSTEMCTTPGSIVGYRTGTTTSKISPSTRIVYMTDHALLNECIADPLLKKYSCLVIDEAHERSLDTDILLACIKQCLAKRHKLRVIITSATINPDVFVKYFGGIDLCPVVRVSGRMFPVDVEWNSMNSLGSPLERNNDSIIDESVNMVKKIHIQEPAGDILVFLTSPRDIEMACQTAREILNDSETYILPLHGRLQPDEQKLVFQECPNKRKIVFSTNVAETSVTIPGIKYIVDTGLAKEMSFDPKRNMNSLQVCLISKSSAEQRKGRAGRVSAGKCFRLYTKEEYANMRDRTPPEILRIHLIQAVLKLYEFGIKDVLSFDFVEAPDKTALQSAMDTLIFLGATHENQLTPLGQRLALFPLDPQLSKILLDGIDVDIGIEAIVSVVISSFGGNVFFRSGTEEMKKESDRMKIQFINSNGDQMTCLNVYRQWSLRAREERNKWCVKNYINAKTMRLVEETVREICHILSSKLQIDIHKSTPSLSQAECLLPKLYFRVFLHNLGIYSGHSSVGYFTLNSLPTDETLVPFPGSSLVQNNEMPKYVIYEKTLKTSRHFLLQTLPVNREWIDEAIEQGKIIQDLSSLEKDRMVVPLTIQGVGTTVSSRLRREVKDLTEEMKIVCNGCPVQLDWSQQKLGKLLIYSTLLHHGILKEFITSKLEVIRNELKSDFHETGVTCPQDNIRVVLGQGGLIQHILMPHEYRTVIVKGPLQELIDEVSADLLTLGDVVKVSFKQFKTECRLFITYSQPSMAVKAVFFKHRLSEQVKVVPSSPKGCSNQVSKIFQLKLEWIRRQRKNFAFVDFSDYDEFGIASPLLFNRTIYLEGSYIKCRLSKTSGLQFFLSNVSLHVQENDLRSVLDEYIGSLDYSVKFGLEKCFETSQGHHSILFAELKQLLSKYTGTDEKYKLTLLSPLPKHVWYRAFVEFEDSSVGLRVMRALNNENIFGHTLNVTRMLSTMVRFTPDIYKVIREELKIVKKELIQKFKTEEKEVLKFIERTDKYGNTIEIKSDDLNIFAEAKRTLNNLILPLVKECDTPLLRHYIISPVSRTELDKIQSETSTVILINTRTMTISIYGTKSNREIANESFDQHMNQLEREGVSVHEIHLKDGPKGLMKYIVSKYGIDLSGILIMEGVKSATLEPRRQILTVFSNNHAFESIKRVVDEYSLPVVKSCDVTVQECCICLCEIEDTSDIFIMEYCGHLSHVECIQVQVSANAVTFPLQCAAEGCQQHFIWQDCENLFKRTSLTLQTLLNTSLKSFLTINKDKARNCPTPDCPMIYKVSQNGERFICSNCNVDICTTCHIQFHDNLTCAMYKSSQGTDKKFHEWLQEDSINRKMCPKCTAAIEKISGCNYICCIQCRTSICWVCLEYFEDSQKCYAHLAKVHGGVQ